jgi:hypothetical protein
MRRDNTEIIIDNREIAGTNHVGKVPIVLGAKRLIPARVYNPSILPDNTTTIIIGNKNIGFSLNILKEPERASLTFIFPPF